MKIYNANTMLASIVIVPREFKPIEGIEALEIVSGEIEEAVREAGDFVGSLVLHTPFKEGLGCFIAAQTRKEGLLDKLVQREDLYGILPVDLQYDELCMLYTVLYPHHEDVNVRDAIRGVFQGQDEFLKNFFESQT